MATTPFEYAAIEMRSDFEDAEQAKAEHAGDPVALMLIEQECSARMNLGDAIVRMRKEAESLAIQAQRIVEMIDSRGMAYSPNSLGEIQSHHVDVYAAKVSELSKNLERAQKALREHLDAKEAEANPVFPATYTERIAGLEESLAAGDGAWDKYTPVIDEALALLDTCDVLLDGQPWNKMWERGLVTAEEICEAADQAAEQLSTEIENAAK